MFRILVQRSVINLITLTRQSSGKDPCFKSMNIGKFPFEKEIAQGPVINAARNLRGAMCRGERGKWGGRGYLCSSDRIVHREKI